MTGTLADWLMRPVETVRALLAWFLSAPERWRAWRQLATVYAEHGITADARAAARDVLAHLAPLDAAWQRARAMMRLEPASPSGSLSAVPLVWVGVAAGASLTALVSTLWYVWRADQDAIRLMQQLMDAASRGDLTPDQVDTILRGIDAGRGGPLTRLSAEAAALLRVLALGALLYVGWTEYHRARPRRVA